MGEINENKRVTSERNMGKTNQSKDKKPYKESFNGKKDVDEFDLKSEYSTRDELESDGEDF